MKSLLSVALAVLLATSAAHAPRAEAGSRAQVQVSARVLTYFRVGEVSHPATIQVEPHHVRQGFMDLEGASTVSLESNATSPITVRVGYDGALVDRVSVRMEGSEITAEQPGETGLVPNPVRGKRRMSIHYRLYLQPGTSPGPRAWPVALALTPTI